MPKSPDGSRQRLLDAAAQLLAVEPEQSVSVRAVCTLAGVQLPTLYHFFENKQGLIDAVVEAAYERFTATLTKVTAARRAPSPAAALRATWDAHIALGASEPALYVLMYGSTRPGHRPRGYEAAFAPLLARCTEAAAQRQLTTSAADAARRLEASAIGATLALIASPGSGPALRIDARDAVVSALTRDDASGDSRPAVAANADALLSALATHTTTLAPEEAALLVRWLRSLASST